MILNYRTIASGKQNKEGQVIKDNLLVRSAYFTKRTPQLTEEYLSIFDLRSEDEIQVEGEIQIDNSEVKHYYLGGDFNKKQSSKLDHKHPENNLKYLSKYMPGFYADLALCPELKAEIQDIVRNPRPALIHCTAGKDRTGVTSAILMELLNFDREAIYFDYLNIDKNLVTHLENKFKQQFNVTVRPEIKPLFTVDKTYLDAFYESIFCNYQTLENYISSFFELTASEINAFKAYYLED